MTVPVIATDLTAVLHREFLLLARNRTNLLLAILPTAVYLLLFSTSLTGLVGTVSYAGIAVGYAEFTIPAIMASSMLAAAATTGTSVFQEELGGMAVELWSYPLRRSSYLGGKLLATTAMVLVQSLAALAVALLVFRVSWSPDRFGAVIVAAMVASLAFNALYLLLGTIIRDFQRFIVIVNVLGPVLLFASPSFYPVETMPAPLRWLSLVNPVTYAVGCLRDGALFGFPAIVPSAAVLVGAAVVLLVTAGRAQLRRARDL